MVPLLLELFCSSGVSLTGFTEVQIPDLDEAKIKQEQLIMCDYL